MESERRKSDRMGAHLSAACRVRGIAYPAMLSDLSHSGCCAELASQVLRPGERVLLQLNQALVLPALVRWVARGQTGLEFANPLHGAMLCRFADRNGMQRGRLH